MKHPHILFWFLALSSCNTFSDLGSTDASSSPDFADTGRDVVPDSNDTTDTKTANDADTSEVSPDDALIVNATSDGTDGCDATHCTLQEAVTEANQSGGNLSIKFDPLDEPIVLSESLVITAPFVSIEVDLENQVAQENRPIIVVDGDFDGVVLRGTNATINGVTILRERSNAGAGIRIEGDGSRIIDVHVGQSATMTTNSQHDVGILVENRTFIRRSTISNAATVGIQFNGGSEGSLVENSRVGLDLDGISAAPNDIGMIILTGDITILDSLVSANASYGIVIRAVSSDIVTINGCNIGTDVNNQMLVNGDAGVLVLDGNVKIGESRGSCDDDVCNTIYSAAGQPGVWGLPKRRLEISGSNFDGDIGVRIGGTLATGQSCETDRACASGGCFASQCVATCETQAECNDCTDGLCLGLAERDTITRDNGARNVTVGNTIAQLAEPNCTGLCNQFNSNIGVQVGRTDGAMIAGNAFVAPTNVQVGVELTATAQNVVVNANTFRGSWPNAISSRGFGHVVSDNVSNDSDVFLETEEGYVTLRRNTIVGNAIAPNRNGFVNWEGNSVTTDDPAASIKSTIGPLNFSHDGTNYQFSTANLIRPAGVLYSYTANEVGDLVQFTCLGGSTQDVDDTNEEAQCMQPLGDSIGMAYYRLAVYRIAATAGAISLDFDASPMNAEMQIVEALTTNVLEDGNGNIDRKTMIAELSQNFDWITDIQLPNGETGLAALVPHNTQITTTGLLEVVQGPAFTDAAVFPPL